MSFVDAAFQNIFLPCSFSLWSATFVVRASTRNHVSKLRHNSFPTDTSTDHQLVHFMPKPHRSWETCTLAMFTRTDLPISVLGSLSCTTRVQIFLGACLHLDLIASEHIEIEGREPFWPHLLYGKDKVRNTNEPAK